MALTTATRTTCFNTNDGDPAPSITYHLPSSLPITTVVFIQIPTGATADYSTNTNVVVKSGSTSAPCDSYIGTQPVLDCHSNVGDTLYLSRPIGLGLCQIGVLVPQSHCACPNTHFDSVSLGANYVNPASLITAVTQGTTSVATFTVGVDTTVISVYNITQLTNSVTVNCGLFCGNNQLVLYDSDRNIEIPLQTNSYVQYNNVSQTLTFTTTDQSYVGLHNYILKVSLPNVAGYFPQQTSFQVLAKTLYCTQDLDLAGVVLMNSTNSNAVPISNAGGHVFQVYYNANGDGFTGQGIFFYPTNFPTCIGFDSTKTVYSAVLILKNGTSDTFGQSATAYSSCKTAKVSDCLLISQSSKQLSFFFVTERYAGTDTYNISVTTYGTTYNGTPLSYTQFGGNGTIWAHSCATTTFNAPVYFSTTFSTALLPNLNVNLGDPTQILSFSVPDTKTTSVNSPLYCGNLRITLLAASNNTSANLALANSLLTCGSGGSCLSATFVAIDTKNYRFDVSLAITDMSFVNQLITFNALIQYENYLMPNVAPMRSTWPSTTVLFNVVTYNDCTIAKLTGTSIVNAATGQAFSTLSFMTHEVSQSLNFQLLNEPVCFGYDASLTTYQGVITKNSVTISSVVYPTLAGFNQCTSQSQSSCMYIDPVTKQIQLHLFDETLVGNIHLQITTTLYSGSIINTFVSNIQISVQSCGASVFQTPSVTLNDFNAISAPLTGPITATLNHATQSIVFTVSDSVSIAKQSSTFCGARTATLIAQQSNALSAQLLSCQPQQSCLQLVTTGYTMTLSLFINDPIFINQALSFRLKVKFANFVQDVSFTNQPELVFDFVVNVQDDPSCNTQADLQGMQLKNQQGALIDGTTVSASAYTNGAIVMSLVNVPTCIGYQQASFDATITSTTTQTTIITSQSGPTSQTCFTQDLNTPNVLQILYNIQNEDFTGTNTVTITPQVSGLDQYNVLTTITYPSVTFTLVVQGCKNTVFSQPVVQPVSGIIAQIWPSLTAYLNYPSQSNVITINDSFNHPICGERLVTLASTDNNLQGNKMIVNSDLSAQSVLNQVTINSQSTDPTLVGTILHFTMTIQYVNFMSSGPVQTYLFDLSLQKQACMSSNELPGMISSSVPSLQIQDYYNANGDGLTDQTTSFALTNIPGCFGYSQTSYAATISNTNQIHAFQSDLNDYTSCKTTATTDCFYIDTMLLQLHYFFVSEINQGNNIIRITAMSSGVDPVTGQSLTYTSLSQFNMEVISCALTTFQAPIYSSSFLNVNLGDPMQIMSFTVPDTITSSVNNPLYCGNLQITLSAASGPTQTLAAYLLSCTSSCLSAAFVQQDATSYRFDISLTTVATDTSLANQNLLFDALIEYHNYAQSNVASMRTTWPRTLIPFSAQITQQLQKTCTVQELTVAIVDSTNLAQFTTQTIYQSQQTSLDFTLLDEPICIGYDSTLTTYSGALLGTSYVTSLSQTEYDNCVALSQSCIFIDPITSKISLSITDPLLSGNVQLQVVVSLHSGQLSNQVTVQIPLTIVSCAATQILVQGYDDTNQPITTIIVQNKPFNQISNNLQSDLNYKYSTFYLEALDTFSTSQNNPSFCGAKTFALTALDSLAEALLSDTSQLSYSQYDDTTLELVVRIMDDSYDGQILNFQLTVSLPSQSTVQNFQIQILPCQPSIYQITPTDQTLDYELFTNQSIVYNLMQVPYCSNLVNEITTDVTDTSTYGIVIQTKPLFIILQVVYNQYDLTSVQVSLTSQTGALSNTFSATVNYFCTVKSVQQVSAQTSYQYTRGSVMQSQRQSIVQTPACNSIGTYSVNVNGTEVQDLASVGLVVQLSVSDTSLDIDVQSNYAAADLDGTTQLIQLTYTVDNISILLEPITAYIVGPSSQQGQGASTSINAPTFQELLKAPPVIPCLDKANAQSWVYNFPTAKDPQDLPITYTFSCSEFKLESLKLTLGTIQPKNQTCKMVVSNPTGASTSYSIQFVVDCSVQSGSSNNSAPTSKNGKTLSKPVPVVKAAQRDGVILIQWSQPMVQTNLSDVKGVGKVSARKLAQQDILIVYNQMSDANCDLSYSYTLEWVSTTVTALDLQFETPKCVSANSQQKDKLQVSFINPKLFISTGGLTMTSNISLTVDLPKQIAAGSVTLNRQQLASATMGAMQGAFATSFLLTAVLNQLLSIIENLTLVIHYFILTLEYPGNVQDFFAALFPLIIFDILPTEQLYEDMFGLSDIEDFPVTDQFNQVGYGQTLVIANMGSLYIVTVIIFGLTLLLSVCNCCIQKCCCNCIRRRSQNYLDGFYWNGLIKFIDQNYLIFCIMSMIQLTNLKLDLDLYNTTEIYNSVLAIMILATCISYPFLITIIYSRKIKSHVPLPDLVDTMQIETIKYLYKTINVEKIKKETYFISQHKQFMETYGCLLADIDLEKLGKTRAIFTAVLPSVRSLLFATCVMLTLDRPMICIMLLNELIIFYTMFLAYKRVYIEEQKKHVFDCCVLLAINYHLYCYTDWLDIDQQLAMGNSVIYFVVLQSVFVIILAIIPIFKTQKLRYKRWRIRRNKKKKKTVHIEVKSTQDKVEVDQTVKELSKEQAINPFEGRRQFIAIDHENQRQIVQLQLDSIESVGSLENDSEKQLPEQLARSQFYSFREQQPVNMASLREIESLGSVQKLINSERQVEDNKSYQIRFSSESEI